MLGSSDGEIQCLRQEVEGVGADRVSTRNLWVNEVRQPRKVLEIESLYTSSAKSVSKTDTSTHLIPNFVGHVVHRRDEKISNGAVHRPRSRAKNAHGSRRDAGKALDRHDHLLRQRRKGSFPQESTLR